MDNKKIKVRVNKSYPRFTFDGRTYAGHQTFLIFEKDIKRLIKTLELQKIPENEILIGDKEVKASKKMTKDIENVKVIKPNNIKAVDIAEEDKRVEKDMEDKKEEITDDSFNSSTVVDETSKQTKRTSKKKKKK